MQSTKDDADELKALLSSDETLMVDYTARFSATEKTSDNPTGLLLEWNVMVQEKGRPIGEPRRFKILSKAIEVEETGVVSTPPDVTTRADDFRLSERAQVHLKKEDEEEHDIAIPNAMCSDRIRHTVKAGPGKLGLIIDKVREGHAISEIKKGSPLKDCVVKGDIIVAVNGDDTRELSGPGLTSLLIRTSNLERRLEILRPMLAPRTPESQGVQSRRKERAGDQTSSTGFAFVFTEEEEAFITPHIETVSTMESDDETMSMASNAEEDQSLGVKAKPVESTTQDSALAASAKGDGKTIPMKGKAEDMCWEVTAYPGTLGLVIADSPTKGHIVSQVKPGSQLRGFVSEGDVILGVDEIDTRDFSLPAFSALLSQNTGASRTLKVCSRAAVDRQAEHPSMGKTVAAAKHAEDPSKCGSVSQSANACVQEVVEVQRLVRAPAGKLGIVVDVNGFDVMVDSLKPHSPLQGLILPGDVIVCVNSTKTYGMTVASFAALMAQTATDPRCIMILRRTNISEKKCNDRDSPRNTTSTHRTSPSDLEYSVSQFTIAQ